MRILFHRAAGVICTVIYLVGGLGLGAQMLAVAAWLEGTHEVLVGRSGEQTYIALHHRAALSNQQITTPHRHGIAAQAICAFAENGNRSETDHVASFAGTCTGEKPLGALEVNRVIDRATTPPPLFGYSVKLALKPASAFPTLTSSISSVLCSTVLTV